MFELDRDKLENIIREDIEIIQGNVTVSGTCSVIGVLDGIQIQLIVSESEEDLHYDDGEDYCIEFK